MKKQYLPAILGAFGFLILILDAKTAIIGAQDAINLCQRSVIPSLFPFIVLSNLVTSGLYGSTSPLLRPLGKLLGIPKGSEGIFLTGILGGYPTGAQAVQNAWTQGALSIEDARRMLGFCNNAGPAFLFGILAPFFPRGRLWLLWIIHILSAVITGVLLPGRRDGCIGKICAEKSSPVTAVKGSVAVMGYICGWIVLFRVLFAFLSRWVLWLIPAEGQVSIYGLMELAGGCCSLNYVADPSLRFVICSAMLACGGLCVAMQTASVTDKLGMGQYLAGKGIQTLCSIWLASCVVTWGKLEFIPCLLAFPALVTLRYFLRKASLRKAMTLNLYRQPGMFFAAERRKIVWAVK